MFHRRLTLLWCIMAATALILTVQMSRLSLVQGAERRLAAEKRLDLVDYLPTTRGRILDRHGRVLAVDRPSYEVRRGDTVSLRPRIHQLARENMESMAGHMVPDSMAVNPAELSVQILAPPSREQIPFEVNTNLIVEFYR